MRKFFVFFIMFFLIGCASYNPVREEVSYFPVQLGKYFLSLYYSASNKSDIKELKSFIYSKTAKNIDDEFFKSIMKKNSGLIIRKKEDFKIELIRDIAVKGNKRFLYFIKFYKKGILSKKYKKYKIVRIICIKENEKWFVYCPKNSMLVSEIYEGKMKKQNGTLIRNIINDDFSNSITDMVKESDSLKGKDAIARKLLSEANFLYESGKYRDAIVLFKKIKGLSDSFDKEVEDGIKKCMEKLESFN